MQIGTLRPSTPAGSTPLAFGALSPVTGGHSTSARGLLSSPPSSQTHPFLSEMVLVPPLPGHLAESHLSTGAWRREGRGWCVLDTAGCQVPCTGHHNSLTPVSKQLRGSWACPLWRGWWVDWRLHFSSPLVGTTRLPVTGALRGQGSGKAGQHLPRLSSLTDTGLDHVFGPKDLLCSGNSFPEHVGGPSGPSPLLSYCIYLHPAFSARIPFPLLCLANSESQASPPSGSSPSLTTRLLSRLPWGPSSLFWSLICPTPLTPHCTHV